MTRRRGLLAVLAGSLFIALMPTSSGIAADAGEVAERGGGLPTMTQPRAKRMVRSSLRGKFDWFNQSYTKKVGCGDRVSRVRLRCKVKFGIGDVYVHGSVAAYYRYRRGDVWWFTKGRVKMVNEYCIYGQDKPKSQCTDIKTWGR